ncbi:MAG: hypothetical protein Ct9H300mP28_18330 [Pseudomonadota bacterium]|nr:MAG: hypothetical protein Ct9H300mP28_18330 [Pseudomonadota bacterium]
MTKTVVSSATKKSCVWGFDQPFVMIGKRINPTGRKLLSEEMSKGVFSRVEQDTLAQVPAGAHMLDFKFPEFHLADEPKILADTIKFVSHLRTSLFQSIHLSWPHFKQGWKFIKARLY